MANKKNINKNKVTRKKVAKKKIVKKKVKRRSMKELNSGRKKEAAVIKANYEKRKAARKKLPLGLKNKLNGNNTLYIHKNSGIPLIGSLSFGIIDRGSNMLEIKPLTSCNADCIFCSVDEGPSSKKIRDIVVEKDYLPRRD